MIRPFQQCRSLDGWSPVEVESSSDRDTFYVVHVNPWGSSSESICECKGYQYRGQCRHQDEALHRVCGWAEGGPEKQTAEQRNRMECPRCGGHTSWQMEVIEDGK